MLRGDFDKLKRLRHSVARLADPADTPQKAIARAVIGEVRKGPLAEQYRTGIGPDGPWLPRKDGKLALVSKKLPRLIRGEPIRGGARFTWRSNIMLAHHQGHIWETRAQAAALRFYDRAGRRLRMGRLTRKALSLTFVEQRETAAHRVGRRVLPPRRQYPRPGAIPPPWRRAIETGARAGVDRWYARATK